VIDEQVELRKDPGIPRLPDLKVRNAEKRKLNSTSQHITTDPDTTMASEPTLSSLALLATQPPPEPLADEDDGQSFSNPQQKTKEQLRRHYVRTLHKVIDQSDIIIHVLDARDPEGCRSRLVEEEVKRRESEGKKLVFVLNKIGAI
jgi:nuclear GTP-binding protein